MNAQLKFRVFGKTPSGRDRVGLTLYPQQHADNHDFFGNIVAGSVVLEVSQKTADGFDVNDEVTVSIEAPDKPDRAATRVADSATIPAPIAVPHPAPGATSPPVPLPRTEPAPTAAPTIQPVEAST